MLGLTSLQTSLIGGAILFVAGATSGSVVMAKVKNGEIEHNKVVALEAIDKAWQAGWNRRDQHQIVAAKSDTANAGTQTKIGNNTQEIIRYVPRYITVKDDAACLLPDNFGRVLDAAQLGVTPDELPSEAGQSVGTPTRLGLSEATGLLTQILGDYAKLRARLLNASAAWDDHAKVEDQPQPK